MFRFGAASTNIRFMQSMLQCCHNILSYVANYMVNRWCIHVQIWKAAWTRKLFMHSIVYGCHNICSYFATYMITRWCIYVQNWGCMDKENVWAFNVVGVSPHMFILCETYAKKLVGVCSDVGLCEQTWCLGIRWFRAADIHVHNLRYLYTCSNFGVCMFGYWAALTNICLHIQWVRAATMPVHVWRNVCSNGGVCMCNWRPKHSLCSYSPKLEHTYTKVWTYVVHNVNIHCDSHNVLNA